MKRMLMISTALMLLTGFSSAAWARKAKPEEMEKLKEQVKAAETAEKQLADLQAEKEKLAAQLAAKEAELQKSADELAEVKARAGVR